MDLVTHTHASVRQHRVLIKEPITNTLNIKNYFNLCAEQFHCIPISQYNVLWTEIQNRFFPEIISITEEFIDKSSIKII